jgi:hypothetical protein
MSVIEVERPAAAAPAPSWFEGWWNLGLRLVLLAVLAVAAVVALPSAKPQSSDVENFLSDLRSGRVASVRYVGQSVEVRWSTDWSHWYHASLQEAPLPKLPPAPDGAVADNAPDGTADQWVQQALLATGHPRLNFDIIDTAHEPGRLAWAGQLPWHGFSVWAVTAAGLAFALMLLRREHRFGNRWAWFWVMGATSGLGAVLYLILEPGPVWQRPSRRRPLPPRPAFFGGAGFLIALAFTPALALVGLLVNAS